MPKAIVRWSVTEVHEAEVEVDDLDEIDTDADLAPIEDNQSFDYCEDRTVLGVTPL